MKVRKDSGKSSERISYEFGPFQVDSHERAVRRSGKLLPLRPKAFDILLVLIQNPGQILEKGEIMEQVWPDTAVEESNLARNVSTLRKALGDEPGNPKYVETIPWRGYRFIAEISKLHKKAETIDSLAVLPFVNEGNSPETEYLSDGITESLIHKLSLLHSLKVMSRQSIFQYKVRRQTEEFPEARKVGLELGVRAVLSGHIRLVNDSVQVGVELVDTSDNHHLWGAQYNRTLSNIVTLQETISRQIAEQLKLTLTGRDKQRLATPQTENPEAYELYLKGRYVLNRMTLENLQKGIELFKQTIEKDPDYALAYTGLLDCYIHLARPVEARKAAAKALELDPTLGEVHASLGFFKFLYDWDFPGAEQEFKQAIELNPNCAGTHGRYATYLSVMGLHEEAFNKAMRARELDPILMIGAPGSALFLARNYDSAIDATLSALELDPNNGTSYSALGQVYALKGMLNEALAQFEKCRALMGGNPTVDANIKARTGFAYAVAGQRAKALKIAEEISRPKGGTPYNIACIYAALGENDRAFEHLESAYYARSPEIVMLKVDPCLDNLRGDPRFQDLLARVGFV